MATKQELVQALKAADAAGDAESATKLANAIRSGRYDDPVAPPPVAPPAAPIDPSQVALNDPASPYRQGADTVLKGVGEVAGGANSGILGALDLPARAANQMIGGYNAAATTLAGGSPADVTRAANVTPIPTVSEVIGLMLRDITDNRPGQRQKFDNQVIGDALYAFGQVFGPGAMGLAPVSGRNLASGPGAAAEFLGFGTTTPASQLSNVPQGTLTQMQADAAFPPPQAVDDAVTGLPAVIEATPAPAQTLPAEIAVEPYVPSPGTPDHIAAEVALKRNNGDISAVGWKLNDFGRAVPDPTDMDLLKSGWKDSFVGTLKGLNQATRAKVREMANTVEKGVYNTGWAGDNPPANVIGRSLDERLKVLRTVTSTAGKQIDDVAENQLKGTRVNVEPAIRTFAENLKKQGIDYNPATGELDFSNSSIRGITATENFIQRMTDYLRETPSMGSQRGYDAYKIHQAKRFFDEQVSYGKITEGLPGSIERIVKELRANLDGALDTQFPAYNKANTMYADAIRVLNDMQDMAGSKTDLLADNSDMALGQMSRKVLSNYGVNPRMRNVFAEADKVTQKWGPEVGADMSKMDDDIIRLVDIETGIRNTMPGVARGNTLQGIMASDVVRGTSAAARGDMLGVGEQIIGMLPKKPDSATKTLKPVKALQKWLDAADGL